MKILIFLAAWRRPEITEICFMGISRLKKASKYPLEAFAVISEESMIPLCEKYGIDYCFHKNNPLGEKKNYGLTMAMEKSWDYLIEIGSDDLLFNETLALYEKHYGRWPIFGGRSLYYLNSETGDVRQYKTQTAFGMGRVISREAIEGSRGVVVECKEDIIVIGRSAPAGGKTFLPIESAKELEALGRVRIVSEPCYKLWEDDKERGLDNNSMYHLMLRGIGNRAIECDPIGVDIKSGVNLWPFNPDLGEKADLDAIMARLSPEEQIALLQLIKRNKKIEIECAVTRL